MSLSHSSVFPLARTYAFPPTAGSVMKIFVPVGNSSVEVIIASVTQALSTSETSL
jgi:hypothetical protein